MISRCSLVDRSSGVRFRTFAVLQALIENRENLIFIGVSYSRSIGQAGALLDQMSVTYTRPDFRFSDRVEFEQGAHCRRKLAFVHKPSVAFWPLSP